MTDTRHDDNKKRPPKIGVFIVAYNAATTIDQVLARIKPQTMDRISEIFIFDDSSSDDTAAQAAESRAQRHLQKVRIFRNQVNLGYGGNQKRGYRYAIEQGFDIVVMLHGDGQYAPEALDYLIDPIVRDDADAVFGSRMMTPGAARRGGMPLYKYVGNRVLTTFQNLALNRQLTEYHSGYRAYRVTTLQTLPFMKNSNDFHFDNEIIVQLMYGGKRILETPIPTYYGGEICYVNGMAYAWNVIKTTFRFRLHRMGLLYSPIFDLGQGGQYAFKPGRHSSHRQIVERLAEVADGRSLKVLELGCGAGHLTRRFAEAGHTVVGVDRYDSQEAAEHCTQFYVVDLDKKFPVREGERFDCVVLADVLEHLRDPEALLLQVRRRLVDGGVIIASTGNVANLYIRLSLLFGRFTYTERGILDRTHCRLFTLSSFAAMIEECGFCITTTYPTPIPFELIICGMPKISNGLSSLNMVAARVWPALFAYQTIVVAGPDDRVTKLLRQDQIFDQYIESPTLPHVTK